MPDIAIDISTKMPRLEQPYYSSQYSYDSDTETEVLYSDDDEDDYDDYDSDDENKEEMNVIDLTIDDVVDGPTIVPATIVSVKVNNFIDLTDETPIVSLLSDDDDIEIIPV